MKKMYIIYILLYLFMYKFNPIPYQKACFDATESIIYISISKSKVLKELTQLESIPNRQEGYTTLAIHQRLFDKVQYLGLITHSE